VQMRERMGLRWNVVVIFIAWLRSVNGGSHLDHLDGLEPHKYDNVHFEIPNFQPRNMTNSSVEWRHASARMPGIDPNKNSIPENILFTHKMNLLEFSDEEVNDAERVLRATMQHTVDSLPGYNVLFFNDSACARELGDIHPELEFRFHNETIGMLKADMCRLALLWSHGGLYFDADILPVVDLHKHVHKNTTFTTVRSTGEIKDNEGFFQAFLGAAPGHPVIRNALQRTLLYYRAKHSDDKEQMEELMLGFHHGNIGTALLLGAFCNYTGEVKNATSGPLSPNMTQGQTMYHADGHVSQIFLEASLSSLDASWDNHGYVLGRDPNGSLMQPPHCEYVVVDRDTKTVVFYSRTYASGEDTFCMVAWLVLPREAFPRVNGTNIPRILHIVGDDSGVGNYHKWEIMNSHWAVKLWTQPETRYFIRQLFPDHIQNSPFLENLSQDEFDSLFSYAIMNMYGGVLALPRDAKSFITLSYWPNQTNVSSYCLFDEVGVVAALAEPHHHGLQKIMKMITVLAELTLGENAAQFTIPAVHHAMTESTIDAAAELLYESICLSSPKAFHSPIPDTEPIVNTKVLGFHFYILNRIQLVTSALALLFGCFGICFLCWKRHSSGMSLKDSPSWVSRPFKAIRGLKRKLVNVGDCRVVSPIKATIDRVGSKVVSITRHARNRSIGKVTKDSDDV